MKVIVAVAIVFLAVAVVLLAFPQTPTAIWISSHVPFGNVAHPARERRLGILCLSIGLLLLLNQWRKSWRPNPMKPRFTIRDLPN